MVEIDAVARNAAALLNGQLPDARPWEIGQAATWIADAIGRQDPAVSATKIRAAGQILNRARMFEHTRLFSRTWIDFRGFDPTITRHLAQALVDLSALDAAETLIRQAIATVDAAGHSAQAAAERGEYEGLLGRIEKDRFVATQDKDVLVAATNRYLSWFLRPAAAGTLGPYWHGINAVALLAREQREGVAASRRETAGALAGDIYKHVTGLYARNASDVWLAATASEAGLALGDCDAAELWLYRFLHHPAVTPFAIRSYERQLREIWQGGALGDGSTCADKLSAIVMRHIMRVEGRWSIASSALQSAANAIGTQPEHERNFSNETGFSVDAIRKMLNACAAIGCVTNRAGERLGTGFVVDGQMLAAGFSGPVFVTNAHVISEAVANAIPPAEARVTFEIESVAAGGPVSHAVDRVLFSSTPRGGADGAAGLDVTVVQLAGLPVDHARLPATSVLPLIEPKARAYVIGHPRGAGLQVSLHDSQLLDIDDEDCFVHYRTPTDPGSSGSPVFNREWQVMAVHHSGSATMPRLRGKGNYEANEAISLSAVQRRLRK
ncbi:MAG: serine protease [Vicinamibacterales bacterium]